MVVFYEGCLHRFVCYFFIFLIARLAETIERHQKT